MFTVTGFVERVKQNVNSFIALEITGGVELIQSNNTGRFYATVRKCTIPSTFNEAIAKSVVGSQIPGNVVRVLVEPYDFINPRTGELMQLQHSYAYQPEGSVELIGQTQVQTVA